MLSLRLRGLSQNVGFRALSTFAKERTKHQQQLKVLRNDWMGEHKAKLAKIEEVKKAERARIVVERAVKLREKKAKAAAGLERQQKIVEESIIQHKLKLSVTQALIADQEKEQQARYAKAAQDLEEESKYWITLENMDSKITEKLFDQPATTGLTTKHSHLWRHHCYAIDIDRLNHMNKAPRTAMEFRRQMRADHALDKKVQVGEYLNSFIGRGEDRAKYSEYLEQFMQSSTRNGMFSDDDDELEEELLSMKKDNLDQEEFEVDDEDEELEQMPEIEKKKKDDVRGRRFGGGKKAL